MNPYEILGLKKDANEDDIRISYKKLARTYHPDVSKEENCIEKFKEVQSAYEVLSDPDKRAHYDRFGEAHQARGRRGKPFTSSVDDFFSFFNQRTNRQVRGMNILVKESVTFEEVLNGKSLDLTYKVRGICETCDGKGGDLGPCEHCEGTGEKVIQGRGMRINTICEACEGSGEIIAKACEHCDKGFTKAMDQTVKFEIPKGVEDGMRFALRGRGEPCAGGSSGDLYVQIIVEGHKWFERLEYGNILVRVPVSYTQLAIGAEIDVPSLTGAVAFKIPPGSQHDRKFRLKGLGLPVFNNNTGIYKLGDELIQVQLEVPTKLEGRHEELIRELSEYEEENITPLRKEFYEKMGE